MVVMRPLWMILLAAGPGLFAQPACPPTPAYSPCDLVFEMNDAEAQAHPNPYLSVEMHAEFRSPRYRTFLMPVFWDGGRRLVIRFTPTGAGQWDYRVTSNLARFHGLTGQLTATEAVTPGFVQPANVHHFRYEGSGEPHLWMGDTMYTFATLDEPVFRAIADRRAAQKFNHIRGLVLGAHDEARAAVPQAGRLNPDHFRRVDERIRYLNGKGIIVDLILAGDRNQLAELFPAYPDRERYIRYLAARYAPFNITWQGVQEFQEYANGRELLKEIGGLLKKFDPYNHPRSTHTLNTSSMLSEDGWMSYIAYQSAEDDLGAIEHQLYPLPQVNLEFAYEDSGAGKTHPHHVDTAAFRKRLWNATMNGQYVTFGNTGTYGGRQLAVDARFADSDGAKQMTAWYDFMSKTRYWDLQPYFDVDGGRALALETIEYIVYVEKPGPVEILVEKKKYDVAWFNPVTGEFLREKKQFDGDKFSGQPPNQAHDWVLHLSREGRKQGMLRSYKFEARRVLLQEVEISPQRIPFEIAQPASGELSLAREVAYEAALRRETRATRAMRYLWTVEVSADGQGARVLATGARGQAWFPRDIARKFPAAVLLRLTGMNANGKVYQTDRIYQLTQ